MQHRLARRRHRPRVVHAVLVKTYPIAAQVVVDGRSFGTTPTYVKVPAHVPVEVHITRPASSRSCIH